MQSYTITQNERDAPQLQNEETSPRYLSMDIDAEVNEEDIPVHESPHHDCNDAKANETYIYFSVESPVYDEIINAKVNKNE